MNTNQTIWESGSVDIDGTTIRYRSCGDGPTIVFIHGLYVGGTVWTRLVERLGGFRCIVPTWPLGAHTDPAPNADLSARAVAHRIPAFLEALGLNDVIVVGNDTGGGLCLAALGSCHPGLSRVSRLVLTNCDSYEHFPPKGFDRIVSLSRRFPPFGRLFIGLMASKPGRSFFMKAVTVNPPTRPQADAMFGAFATSKESRADALRTTDSLEPSVTLDAVDALKKFQKPVLLAWGDSDKLFPVSHAERLAADFPNTTLHVLTDASTYVMIDKPDELAETIRSFCLL